jgi:predicted RNA binding protein YcfA (HicA-like mRNA interferase family)
VKPLPIREVMRKPEAAGFVEATQRGSHVKLIKITGAGTRTVTVPQHREVAAGTTRSVPRQAANSESEFEAL